MVQVTSCKIARYDWLLTRRDFYVIMKIVNALWTKTNAKSSKKLFLKIFLRLETKQNTEMSDEEHWDSELYYREEQETAEECYVAAVGILTKL